MNNHIPKPVLSAVEYPVPSGSTMVSVSWSNFLIREDQELTNWLINPESVDQSVPTVVIDDDAIVAQHMNGTILHDNQHH